MSKDRQVQSLSIGDTLIRMTQSSANVYDYTVSAEDTSRDCGDFASVTFPNFSDATAAFSDATRRATGHEDDLKVLLGLQ